MGCPCLTQVMQQIQRQRLWLEKRLVSKVRIIVNPPPLQGIGKPRRGVAHVALQGRPHAPGNCAAHVCAAQPSGKAAQ
eukprot:10371249-Karenia_brevis.AAC.1